jgi:hypothetical protein
MKILLFIEVNCPEKKIATLLKSFPFPKSILSIIYILGSPIYFYRVGRFTILKFRRGQELVSSFVMFERETLIEGRSPQGVFILHGIYESLRSTI